MLTPLTLDLDHTLACLVGSADMALYFNANNVIVIPKPYKWA